ncbi:DNA polymerase subunit gamma-2, mitochondrial [Anopheles aquasalis]|uniref:DNA polymerase subunit gamma-2, mitochondrial n=1 Tax=Anopheles aquasalis TaxID=42839 RepID=UPI00215A8D7D|nr:DNA polymerase subunit gamma-2, mitochondrial [Anopheles aquasalis]
MASGIDKIRSLLDLCRRSKFVDFSFDQHVVQNLRFAPIGQMLMNNLRQQLQQQFTLEAGVAIGQQRISMLTGDGGMTLGENLQHLLRSQRPPITVPLGITVEQCANTCRTALPFTKSMACLEIDSNGPVVCTSYLIEPTHAPHFFHQAQRQRKIWWMRLSANPGRYFISDAHRTESDGCERSVVTLRAHFTEPDSPEKPSNVVELEWLELLAGERLVKDFPKVLLKTSLPSVVNIRQQIDRITLAVLMDALDSPTTNGAVRLHRKIAPFKCAIVSRAKDSARQGELDDLAKHIAYVLRKADISLLDNLCPVLPTGADTADLTAAFDACGVPYVFVLRDESLETGLLELRSRDTTLCETIHLSDLPHYLIKLVRS